MREKRSSGVLNCVELDVIVTCRLSGSGSAAASYPILPTERLHSTRSPSSRGATQGPTFTVPWLRQFSLKQPGDTKVSTELCFSKKASHHFIHSWIMVNVLSVYVKTMPSRFTQVSLAVNTFGQYKNVNSKHSAALSYSRSP